MSTAETIANKLLDELNIAQPDDLHQLRQIVFARGAIYREQPISGAEARLLTGIDKPVITVSSSPTVNPQRRRFSIAHELGHLEMHRESAFLISCAKDDIQYKPNNAKINIEQEANQFASSFLMPKRFVQKPFSEKEPSFEIISEWAKKLDTSLTATAIRFTQLSIEPVAIVFSLDGIIQYFNASPAFSDLGVFLDVKKPVGASSIAKKLFSGLSPKKQWHEVRAIDWFRENRDSFDKKDLIKEWSIKMNTFNAVLSLLWVHKPLGEDDNW